MLTAAGLLIQVEEGTPFEKWYPAGTTLLPQDEEGALMYEDASRILQEVFPPSSYARARTQ